MDISNKLYAYDSPIYAKESCPNLIDRFTLSEVCHKISTNNKFHVWAGLEFHR